MTTSLSTSGAPRIPAGDAADHEVRKHLPRNFLAHSIEGGLYMGGMTFLSASIVGPKMVEALGGPAWLTAAMPQILTAGYLIPPLLTAHWMERLVRFHPLLLTLGFFQRIVYLIAGAVLFWGFRGNPAVLVAAAALAPLISGMVAGSGITAWQEFVANAIPPHRRSSVWATRNAICCLIGLGAGAVVLKVLDAFPGPRGYGLLHLTTFAFLTLSYIAFACTREIPNPRPRPGRAAGVGETLADIWAIVRTDRRFRLYLLSAAFNYGLFIMMPFMTIFTLNRLGWREGQMGWLLSGQMLGAIAGNLLAAWIGDRWGGRRVLLTARTMMLAVCLWMPWARTPAEFLGLFFLFGAGSYCNQVGHATLGMELCPLDRRIRYLASISGVGLVSMLTTWILSMLAWRGSGGSFLVVALLSAATVAISTEFLRGVVEPRHEATRNTTQ
ncbi:MAG: MFS transporter [Planctomycetes bacterium]|nr:MFS transporter [Planctomycetota bacterium]